jgi:hypothetical protein
MPWRAAIIPFLASSLIACATAERSAPSRDAYWPERLYGHAAAGETPITRRSNGWYIVHPEHGAERQIVDGYLRMWAPDIQVAEFGRSNWEGEPRSLRLVSTMSGRTLQRGFVYAESTPQRELLLLQGPSDVEMIRVHDGQFESVGAVRRDIDRTEWHDATCLDVITDDIARAFSENPDGYWSLKGLPCGDAP